MNQTTDRKRYPFKAQIIGPLCVTWCIQAGHAPLVDSCTTRDKEGRTYAGWAILLKPWRRNEHGESLPQPALILAWRKRYRASEAGSVSVAPESDTASGVSSKSSATSSLLIGLRREE